MSRIYFSTEVNEANKKFAVGDSLTNHEVIMLHKLYEDASKAMDALHRVEYRLVSNDLYKNRNTLADIKTARGLK